MEAGREGVPARSGIAGSARISANADRVMGDADLPTDVLAMIVIISCIQAMAPGVSTRIRPPPGGSCKVHQCRAGSMATVARIDTTAYRPASSVRSAWPRMCRRSSCPAGTCAYAVLAAVSSVLAPCVVPRSSSAFPSTYEVLVVGPRRRVLAAPVRYTLRGGMQRLWSGNL